MPKVKTESITYRGQPTSEHDYGRKCFQRDIWLDNKTGRFSAKLPDAVAAFLGVDNVRGGVFGMTLAEVIGAFDGMIKAFEEAEIIEKKVIMYEFSFRRDPDGGGYGFYQGVVLCVASSVFTEQEIRAHSGLVVYKYLPVASSLNPFYAFRGEEHGPDTKRKLNQIPWTEERESFFLYIQTNMERLIDMLKSLEEPDKLLNFVDTGRMLPIGTTEGKGES